MPREVLVPELPEDHEALSELLSEIRGSRVSLRVPQRGDKRSLMQTVQRNAEQAFVQYKLRRASDLTARSQALADLQEALDMPDAPLRIECFDISHVQGTNVVASMVVFEDGLARKSEYRRFSDARDRRRHRLDRRGDPAPVRPPTAEQAELAAEAALATEAGSAASDLNRPAPLLDNGRPKKFAYPPNLVVVDGGAPQVAAAQDVLSELGITDVTLVGLAKRLEEVWLPEDDHPMILPRTSEALYLLQRVRDEAHRFAITFHRQKRSKSMTESELAGIAGLGPARRKALLKQFSSLKKLRPAERRRDRRGARVRPGTGPAGGRRRWLPAPPSASRRST